MKKNLTRRQRAKIGIKRKVVGTTERPRLSVYRSLNHIYAQLLDDSTGKTLTNASTLSKEIQADLKKANSNVERSKIVGTLIAKKAQEQKIDNVVFDRSGYRYHGRVKSLAEGAREGGLKF
jgi:large subunit ribosomal protein L18